MLTIVHAQTTGLDRFVGRDLWKQAPSKIELGRLSEILKVPKGYVMEPRPWHVWRTKHGNETRYIVLLGENLREIPGGISACVELFDGVGSKIGGWCFQAGWRALFVDASIEYSADLASDLIVLQVGRVINGRDIAKEYFAISSDRLRFIRLENAKGDAVQNEYVFSNAEIGIAPDANAVDDWARLLESQDKSDVLAALVFLGGRHLTEPERHLLPEPQEGRYGELFRQLLDSPRILALIARLGTSENQWIAQAAALAARGPRERLFQ